MTEPDGDAPYVANQGVIVMKTMSIKEKMRISDEVSTMEWLKHRGKDFAAIDVERKSILATGDDAVELEDAMAAEYPEKCVAVVPNEHRDSRRGR